jgi:hypothetical protein
MCVEIGCSNGITYVEIGYECLSPRIDQYDLIRVEIAFFTSLQKKHEGGGIAEVGKLGHVDTYAMGTVCHPKTVAASPCLLHPSTTASSTSHPSQVGGSKPFGLLARSKPTRKPSMVTGLLHQVISSLYPLLNAVCIKCLSKSSG